MKLYLIGGMLLLLGFMLGVGYSMAEMPTIDPTSADQQLRLEVIRGFQRQSEAIDGRFAELQRRLDRDPGSARAHEAANALPQSSAAPMSARDARAVERAGATAGTHATRRAERLAEFALWSTSAAVRDRWASATADDIREWLGPADRVAVLRDGGTLTYSHRGQDRNEQQIEILVREGRVRDVTITAVR